MYPDNLPPYAKLYCKVVQPAFEKLRHKITPQVEEQIGRSQWLDPQALLDHQWRELEALLRHSAARVAWYRDWFSDNKLSVDEVVRSRDLTLLPLSNKPLFHSQPGRFLAEPMPKSSFMKATGGTTGLPLRFMLDPHSDHWRQAMSRRGYSWAGVVPGRNQVHVWSHDLVPLSPKAALKRDVHRIVQRQHHIKYYKTLTPTDMDKALATIHRIGPDCIVAYTSAAESLGARAQETGWKPRRPLVSVLTGAEALFDHQREKIEAGFGCPAFETYGSREFMLIAAECEAHQGLHISAENLMVEIIKDGKPAAPGEVGEVVITDLHNFAHPFIRYQTGDMTSLVNDGQCACGRGLPRLAPVEGRVTDMIRTPDGGKLSGIFSLHLLKDFEAIERFQIEQDRIDHVIIRVVLAAPLAQDDRDYILNSFREMLPGVEPEFEEVDQVKVDPSGKIRMSIGLKDDAG